MYISPDLEGFIAAGTHRRLVPVYTTVLADAETPLSLYRKLGGGATGTFLLESAAGGQWSRYSFIGSAPVATLIGEGEQARWEGTPPAGVPAEGNLLEIIRATLQVLAVDKPHPELPPLISGFVGYLGWDMVRQFERLGHGPLPEHGMPTACLMIPGDIAIYDHYTSQLTLVANCINVNGEASGIEAAYQAGRDRVAALLKALSEPAAASVSRYSLPEPEVKARTDHDDYLASIATAKERIVDGDIFQVVIGQRFDAATTADPLDVYRVLRTTNPSPYMYLLNLPDSTGQAMAIVGSSPEALVTVTGNEVLTHPIAGSRPRGATPEADRALAEELLADEKERAEHLMLVDLSRNDLAKVCEPGSVDVVEFMEIERFSHIMHIVSTVTGRLQADCDGIDVLAATFPAGTLSGAPKPRALEIIDELEPVARGLYGGVVGYLSFTGDLDMAIAIRTGVIRGGVLSVSAGGGIVADSVPQSEYEESQNKAAAVLRAAAAAATITPAGFEAQRQAGEPR